MKFLLSILAPLFFGTGTALYCQAAPTTDGLTSDGLSAAGSPSGGITHIEAFGSSLESVNPKSGNLNVTLPLLHLKGVGFDTDLTLYLNSNIWTYTGEYDADYVLQAGWLQSRYYPSGRSLGFARTGFLDSQDPGCQGYVGDDCSQTVNKMLFVGVDGSETSLTESSSDVYHVPFGTPTALYTDDGSYIVMSKDGIIHYPDGRMGAKDLNGNSIRCGQSNLFPGIATSDNCLDTANHPIGFIDDAWGQTTGIVYYDTNGSLQTITLVYANVPFSYGAQNIEDISPGNYEYFDTPRLGSLLTKVILANGQTYSFDYRMSLDQSITSGELTKLTLPTGGYVRYDYPAPFVPGPQGPFYGGSGSLGQGVVHRYISQDGTPASEVTYSYTYGEASGVVPGTYYTASVTSPDGSTFSEVIGERYATPSIEETQDASGNILRLVTRTPDCGYPTPFSTAPVQNNVCGYFYNPDPRYKNETVQTDGQPISATSYSYDLYNNPIQVTVLDSQTQLTHTVTSSYVADTNPAYAASSVNLIRLLSSTTATGSDGNSSTTNYTYDANNGSPQGAYGNRTSVDKLSDSGEYLSTQTIVNGQGMPIKIIDPRQNSTVVTYQCSGSNPYQVTNSVFTTTYTYDCNTGLLTGMTDPNGATTSYSYDAVFSPTSIAFPTGGGRIDANYNSYSAPLKVVTTRTASPDPSLVKTLGYDGLGRVTSEQLTSAPGGATTVDTTYDSMGRVFSKSNPHITSQAPTDGESYSYDGLGRATYDCHSLTGFPCTDYLQWDHAGPLMTSFDEARHAWKRTTDAWGRLTSLVEPSPFSGIEAGPTTLYGYDSLSNLTSVLQQGNGSETPRSRSFTYDSLSRLILSSNPEVGTICYGTWSGGVLGTGVCQNGYDANGNLTAKTDATGAVTNFSYEALNRLVAKSSSGVDGSVLSSCYQYDVSNSTVPAGNLIGRMTNEWTQKGTCTPSPVQQNVFSQTSIVAYDPLGRVRQSQQCVLGTCQSGSSFSFTQSYDLAGNLSLWTDGVGMNIFTQMFDSAGRPSSVMSSWVDQLHPGTLFSESSYSPAGGLAGATYGNTLQLTRTYDSRLRPSTETVTGSSGAQSGAFAGGNILVTGQVQSK